MMVRMVTHLAGPELSASAGQEISVSAKLGKDLVSGGYAVPLKGGKVETATVKPQETAAKGK